MSFFFFFFSIFLIVPPTWKHKPSDIEAKSGDIIFLDCSGNGKPNPTFKWAKITGNVNMSLQLVIF